MFKLRNKYDKFESVKLSKKTGDQFRFVEKTDETEEGIRYELQIKSKIINLRLINSKSGSAAADQIANYDFLLV